MDIAKVPSRNAFQVTEVHLGDRKVCSWLGTQFFFPWSLSFLKGLAGSSCLHCLPIPQVLGCWNYRLLFYRNSEPCALKMHDLQSVIKGRINCRLPVTNEIQKATQNPGYHFCNITVDFLHLFCKPWAPQSPTKAKAFFHLP